MRCLSCQYDLRNLTSGGEHRCPECGRVFDPGDARTFDAEETERWDWLLWTVISAILLASPIWLPVLVVFIKSALRG